MDAIKLKYPYYKQDNSLSNLSTVTDARGNTEYRINCKMVEGIWYVKNVDLMLVDNKWILKDKIVLDHETMKEVAITAHLINGAVSFQSNGDPVMGYFSPNSYNNCFVRTRSHGRLAVINSDVIPLNLYIEDLLTGNFECKARLSVNDIEYLSSKRVLNNGGAQYNIEDDKLAFNHAIKLYAESNVPIENEILLASRYIKGITFGAELETINGNLPQRHLLKYGVMICKDGSIKDGNGSYPPEYVTVPYSGAKGLQSLRNVSKEIAKRSAIDIKCSYHLHIGGIAIDRLFMVSLFKLSLKIQDDVFKMFPYYKTDPSGIKAKNYCKKLPQMLSNYVSGDFNNYINSTYADIFTFLSGGMELNNEYNRESKRNPWGEGKWNIKTRYYWINFINLLFSPRNTIEFRVHTPTLNGDKIINWLFMCNAIVRYAEKYPKKCISTDKISFVDVLKYYSEIHSQSYATKLSNNLIEYYNKRCKTFATDLARRDHISMHDIENDQTNGINTINII